MLSVRMKPTFARFRLPAHAHALAPATQQELLLVVAFVAVVGEVFVLLLACIVFVALTLLLCLPQTMSTDNKSHVDVMLAKTQTSDHLSRFPSLLIPSLSFPLLFVVVAAYKKFYILTEIC